MRIGGERHEIWHKCGRAIESLRPVAGGRSPHTLTPQASLEAVERAAGILTSRSSDSREFRKADGIRFQERARPATAQEDRGPGAFRSAGWQRRQRRARRVAE